MDEEKRSNGGYEIIFRFGRSISCQQCVKRLIVRICKEDRLHIGITDSDMLHAVFFFVSTCQFMLLDNAIKIVIYICSNNNTILGFAIHCLGVYIIMFLGILNQPSILLEKFKILFGTFINTWVVFGSAWLKINFRFDDMIKTLLVIPCFYSCLF